MTLQTFITSTLGLVCPSQTAACYGWDEGLPECTRLPRGAGSAPTLQCWPSASWNSGPHTRYTPNNHRALVLPHVGHNLSWAKPPLFNERLAWVTTTSQVRKGWGAGRGTSKHDLEGLPVLDNCSQAVQSLPWVRAQLFISRMKQVLEGASKLCAERQQHMQNQKSCDFNNFWITHVGVHGVGSQNVSYVPHLVQLSTKHGAGCKPVMWRAVEAKDCGISVEAGTSPRCMWCKWGPFAAEHDRQKSGPGLPSFTYHG